ncbi:MAG: ABC transporter ATP-binding protein [Myxococcota bacterium]
MSRAETPLEARAVTVVRGGRPVVRDVSLAVSAGTVTGVLGPNGAGKSTLLLTLLGALPSGRREGRTAGSVSLEGRPLETWTAPQRAMRIAYVPQRTELSAPLSVASVVALGRHAHGQTRASERDPAVAAALDRAEVGALAGRRFDTLSGGERRRVLLARALATEARVLLLDEPAASLDVGHGLIMYAQLRALAADGYAIAVVLHDLDDALRFTDRALLLQEGRGVADGPTASVLSTARVASVYGVDMVPKAGLRFEARSGRP